ncbi:MAG: hypothetical protein P4N24_20975 [Acidobacteriota bacterium]|nr:hypothetical protein [Acidobacteriota bacterium]
MDFQAALAGRNVRHEIPVEVSQAAKRKENAAPGLNRTATCENGFLAEHLVNIPMAKTD